MQSVIKAAQNKLSRYFLFWPIMFSIWALVFFRLCRVAHCPDCEGVPQRDCPRCSGILQPDREVKLW